MFAEARRGGTVCAVLSVLMTILARRKSNECIANTVLPLQAVSSGHMPTPGTQTGAADSGPMGH